MVEVFVSPLLNSLHDFACHALAKLLLEIVLLQPFSVVNPAGRKAAILVRQHPRARIDDVLCHVAADVVAGQVAGKPAPVWSNERVRPFAGTTARPQLSGSGNGLEKAEHVLGTIACVDESGC